MLSKTFKKIIPGKNIYKSSKPCCNNKKITHVTFDMNIGGAEKVIYNLIQHTDKSKYEVSIICLHQSVGPFGLQLQEQGIKIIAFNRRPGFDLFLIKQLRRYVLKQNIDILHCHQYTPYVYGVLAAIGTKTRVIYTEHGRFYPDKRKIKRVMVNPLLSLFTSEITAISKATQEALIKYENFPAHRIRVIYNGIADLNGREYSSKCSLKESIGIPGNAFVLGAVARLDPIKNHVMMIRGLKLVHEKFPNTYLMIVGDGPEKNRLQALVKQYKLTSKVIITGFQEDVTAFYNMMNIFLLTSFSEGTAMTLLEAMCLGLPSIVTDVGGNSEIVQDSENGFVIPNDDEFTLANRICLLINDKTTRSEFERRGRKRFEKQFNIDKMVDAYQDLYEKVFYSNHCPGNKRH